MLFRSPLDGAMEHLPTARAFLAVPSMAGASVKTPEFMEQLEDVGRFHQGMIMIWQNAPGDGAGCVLLKHVEECSGEAIHALRRVADVMRVFIAGSGDEEMKVTVIGPVRWRMPRAGVVLAPGENFLALLGRELPPNVARGGHGQWYGVPALAGGVFAFSSVLKIFKRIVFACGLPAEAGTPYY